MAQYQLKITIQATRLPDPIPMPAHDPGKDPIGEMVQVMKENMRPIAIGMYPYRESGVTLTKEVNIGAESFNELANTIGQFDALAEQIECANATKKW